MAAVISGGGDERTEPIQRVAPEFELTVSAVAGGEAFVRILGEIDAFTVGQLQEAVERVLGAGASRVEIDLGGVTFIDSSGLAELIAARTRLDARSGELVLRQIPDMARRLFEITGVDGYLGVTG